MYDCEPVMYSAIYTHNVPGINHAYKGLVKREQELHESWEARVYMRIFWTLIPLTNENKSYMRVDESWEARVCIRVFSTLMARSNENKCCMRVDESWLDIPPVAKGFQSLPRFTVSHKRLPVEYCTFWQTVRLNYKWRTFNVNRVGSKI
jgi:hypothetical protein